MDEIRVCIREWNSADVRLALLKMKIYHCVFDAIRIWNRCE